MKIALVAAHASSAHVNDPFGADQAAHVTGLGRALAAQGHEVTIYARKDSPSLPARHTISRGLTAEYIAAGPAAPVPNDQLPKLASEIARHLVARWSANTPDVVHAYHWTSGLAALAAAREVPVPVVQTFGSLAAAERRAGVAGEPQDARRKMESCIARAATAVLATTSDEIAELSRLGVPSARVTCVPVGVDTEAFKPDGHVPARKKHPTLITVGSLAPYRRIDLLLRCLAELPGAELIIVGGPAADDLEADHGYRVLAKLAAHLGITERVRFTGSVSDTKLAALLKSAQLLVSATSYEPASGTAIRAMACGVPVAATAVGSYADAVLDGTCGLLIPAERPAALARRLRELLSSPMRLAAFGIAASDRARSRYSWDRIAMETTASYEKAITAAPRPEPVRAATTVRPIGAQAAARRQPVLDSAADHAA
jgi:glycosyltransferase involved in cell wall biosynthesis